MRIAIISFNHVESSSCLAKYIASNGHIVDYIFVAPLIHDSGVRPGLEYRHASKTLGLRELREIDIPELYKYSERLPLRWFILRILGLSPKVKYLNYPIWLYTLRKIKKQKYDAIEIVGQHNWVNLIHHRLRTENIVHTIHEVGSHQNNISSTSLIDNLIKDKSRLIFHSIATKNRFLQIPGSENCSTIVIPFGKFETSLLYERDVVIKHDFDLSKPTFLLYGFLKPYKGLDVLCNAIKLLQEYENYFNLIIAGAGTDSTLPFFSALRNCLVINRYISNDEMMKLNRICSVVLLPYHTASQTGIIPTCFMFNKPVIATRVGAFVETVKNEINGLLVEPNSAIELANAIKRCIFDDSLLKKISEGTKTFGRGDDYDWNRIAQKHISFMSVHTT